MSADQSTEPSKTSRSKYYYIIGWFLLVVMALVWSLDKSLVYFTLGGAVYFFFLGLWHNRSGNAAFEKNSDTSLTDTIYFLKSIFAKNKPTTTQSQGRRGVTKHQSGKSRVALIIFFSIFFSFFGIILFVISSASDDVPLDATLSYERANEFANSGEYDSAAVYYQKALILKDDYAEAYAGLGYVYLMKENYDSALTNFDRSLVINPTYDYSLYSKALVYYYQKKYKQSLQESFKTIEANPSYYSAIILVGDNYNVQSQYDSAIYWYEKGYDSGVRSMELSNVMAAIYENQGKMDKAISQYKEALNYDSTNVSIYTRLGELLPLDEAMWYRNKARELTNNGY